MDPIYREMKKLKTLTVVELESMMKKALRDTGFENFTIEKPDIDRYVVVEFTVKDTKKNREDRASIYDLQKLLKTALKLTNWRLMSEGIDYRLGYLSGRLKGYEREEDLYKLAKQLYK